MTTLRENPLSNATRTDFTAWAQEVLRQYPLHEPLLRWIGQSDNVTFQVTDSKTGALYLLRMHLPVEDFFSPLRREPRAILSELQWLHALRQQTSIPVQQVTPTTSGELLTLFPIPQTGVTIPCSLLGWLEGESFQPENPHAKQILYQLGEMVAILHNHASAWQPPQGFFRPSYTVEEIHRTIRALAPAIELGLLTPAEYAELEETGEAVYSLAAQLPVDSTHWGLVHNDLHAGNWLIHAGKIFPIDFSLCGFGYYLFDISICVGSAAARNTALGNPFFTGYGSLRSLPDGYQRMVEGFMICSRMGYYAFILPRPEQHAWLRTRIPAAITEVCRPFLRGEPIFFLN